MTDDRWGILRTTGTRWTTGGVGWQVNHPGWEGDLPRGWQVTLVFLQVAGHDQSHALLFRLCQSGGQSPTGHTGLSLCSPNNLKTTIIMLFAYS